MFGRELRPFAVPHYLVAPHGDGPGVDTGLLASRDGQPRIVPVVRVDDLEGAMVLVRQHGGHVVVEPFAVPGVGSACYIIDPAGVLIGLQPTTRRLSRRAEC
ncbi:hypothetical protein ACNTMW_15480 [Planosporangium sp. 12N6]|uniref:hypothetical protein n=1 Tax=Planosporangium spinosum TaxID=3402278 RepID=UPI003CEF49FC